VAQSCFNFELKIFARDRNKRQDRKIMYIYPSVRSPLQLLSIAFDFAFEMNMFEILSGAACGESIALLFTRIARYVVLRQTAHAVIHDGWRTHTASRQLKGASRQLKCASRQVKVVSRQVKDASRQLKCDSQQAKLVEPRTKEVTTPEQLNKTVISASKLRVQSILAKNKKKQKRQHAYIDSLVTKKVSIARPPKFTPAQSWLFESIATDAALELLHHGPHSCVNMFECNRATCV
jgi:hypothetical protein